MQLETVEISDRLKPAVAKAIFKFLSGQSMLTYTSQEGIALYLDKQRAVLLDFNLKDLKGIIDIPISITTTYALAMTYRDAIFIKHLLYLRQDLLNKMHMKSLNWILMPYYYIKLQNGKQVSLPSLLMKYAATAKRNSITLSMGLWLFMWYYNIQFTLPDGILSINDTGKADAMLKSEFKSALTSSGNAVLFMPRIAPSSASNL